MVNSHILKIEEFLSRTISGYSDFRMESSVTEKLGIGDSGVRNQHNVFRTGQIMRIAEEKGFSSFSGISKAQGREIPFADFLKGIDYVANQSQLIEPSPDSRLNPKLQDLALELYVPGFSFSFSYEDRMVSWANNLRRLATRRDTTNILKIVAMSQSKSIPLTLRQFIRSPNEFKLRESVAEMQRLIHLLNGSKLATPGEYDVVLHPSVSSVLVHELVGHYSEVSNKSLFDISKLGTQIASKAISVSDIPYDVLGESTPTFDDEGVVPTQIPLIRDGVLTDELHTLETSFQSNSRPNGRGRSRDFRYAPRSRMMNICIEPGSKKLEELISAVDDGYYLMGSLGGIYRRKAFQISCQYGYQIKRGKLADPILKPEISGNIFETLMKIEAVANDLTWVQDGGCLAEEQFLLSSGRGSPHVLIRGLVVH